MVQGLRDRGVTLCTAESCTGGLLGGRLTRIPGVSAVYAGGWIVYGNAQKRAWLGVQESILEGCGAVSRETLEALLRGALANSGADAAAAVTGIAGPGGGTPDKPRGTVWYGMQVRGEAPVVRRARFRGGRNRVRRKTVQAVIKLLLRRFRKGRPWES